jgi:hypothetical protein
MKNVFATFFFLASVFLLLSILDMDYFHYELSTKSTESDAIVTKLDISANSLIIYSVSLTSDRMSNYRLFVPEAIYEVGDTVRIKYIKNTKNSKAKPVDMPDWFLKWVEIGLFIIVYTLAIGLWVISKENLSKVIDAYVRFIEKLKFIK